MLSAIKKHIQQFALVCDSDIDDFISLGTDVEFSAHHFLSTHGSLTEYIYFVYSGIVREYLSAGPGTKHIVRIFSAPGPYTPSLVDFLYFRPAYLYSETLTPLKAKRWHSSDFFSFFDKHPKFYKVFFEGVIRAVDSKEYERRMECELNTTERYLELIDNNPELARVLSIQDIASYLGVRRETISRIRSKLRHRKI